MSQGILYKYLDFNGAKASLENLTIKYSIVDNVNDPMEYKVSRVENITPEFLKAYFEAISKILQGKFNITDETLVEICNKLNGKSKKQQIEDIYNFLKKSFTFCSLTKNNAIMPMWYHYAEKYEGIVIGYPEKFFQ